MPKLGKGQSGSNWAIVAHLVPGLRAQPGRVATAVACLCASVLLRIIEPWPLQFVIDSVLLPLVEQSTTATQTKGWAISNTLGLCALALIVIASARAVADYYRAIIFSIIGNQVVSELRAKVFRHLQTLSLSFHQKSRNGDLTVRLVGDMNMLKEITVSAILPLISSGLVLVGMFAYMLYLNRQLGLMVLSVLPLFYWFASRKSKKIQEAAAVQRKREGALAATAAESMSAIKSVQAHGAGGLFDQAFASSNRKSLREGVRTGRLTAGLERSVDILIAIASSLVLWQGSLLVLDNALSPGGLVVYLTYLKRGFKPLQNFAKYTGRISKAMAAGERVAEILAQAPEIQDSPHACEAPRLTGHIKFENLSFSYPDSSPVLDNFNLELPAKQSLAIVGPSGAGKSTLLSLILRLYEPDGGRVVIDGEDIRSWKVQSLREQIGVVLQETTIFAATVRENIALNLPATEESIVAAAKLAQAHEFIQRLPDGYETCLGERGANLSQGQRQRIALARAVLRNCPILLLDEPTSNLDPQNKQEIATALCNIAQTRTILLVTHDDELASKMQHVLRLEPAHAQPHCGDGLQGASHGSISDLEASRAVPG